MKIFNTTPFSEWIQKIYFKVWWIDVLYPLLLSCLLFWSLSYLLYSGQKHRRVSSQIESRLIYWSLRAAGPRVIKNPSPFITVSLDEDDFKSLNQLHIHDHRDTSLINYASLLNRLLDLSCVRIFIHWQADAFPHGSHYEPLYPIIEKARKLGIELYFVVHPTLMTSLPPRFREQAQVLEADPCDSSLQILCVYDPGWDKWVMQKISSLYGRHSSHSRILEPITHNLPPQSLAHLLYYNSYQDFINLSFRDILELSSSHLETLQPFFKNKSVFIGNALIQGRSGMMKSADINRVKTVLDPLKSSARKTGTPLHKYWAQHAQMFHDNALIGILPYELSLSLASVLALSIILILLRFGPVYSLLTFLLFACLAPLLNILAIRYFLIYVPIFDALYAGFLSFLLATFAKLSVESFYHWRLRIEQKSDSELLSAKSHFVSLLSHNLNTPVAKMQGILTAVENYSPHTELREDLQKAQRLVSTIQLSIRSVLVTTALEEKELNHEAFVLGNFLQSFKESMLKTLGRLGVNVELILHESELSNMPVRFDRRALTMGLSSFFILLAEETGSALTMTFEICENVDRKIWLMCKAQWKTGVLKEDFLSYIQANVPQKGLLEELTMTALNSFVKTYQGHLSISEQSCILYLSPH